MHDMRRRRGRGVALQQQRRPQGSAPLLLLALAACNLGTQSVVELSGQLVHAAAFRQLEQVLHVQLTRAAERQQRAHPEEEDARKQRRICHAQRRPCRMPLVLARVLHCDADFHERHALALIAALLQARASAEASGVHPCIGGGTSPTSSALYAPN
jgi:hypothetical protein